MKDEIYNFRRLYFDAVYEKWLRFKKNLRDVLSKISPNDNWLLIFYRTLNTNNKVVVDTTIGGVFMSLTWEQSLAIQNRIAKLICG